MTPSLAPPCVPQIRLYQNWLRQHRGLSFDSYDALWRWSVTDLDTYWQSIWDYFDLQSPTPHSAVCDGAPMPNTRWFVGARVNYAQQVLRHVAAADAGGFPAILSHNEETLGSAPARQLSWPELRRQVASLALHLQAQGVLAGDRVAAYLPNSAETMVAFLATVSIGAVWSVCAPDMGSNAVLDRFQQIEPKVLIACDGVTYGGRELDRRAVLVELCAALPTVRHLIVQSNLGLPVDTIKTVASQAYFTGATGQNDAETDAFEPLWLPFDHPLWVVYSSGTTGLPKPIVHGHGGTLLVALSLKNLHNDVGCSYDPNTLGERYHWYSTTGWVMWNAQASGLLSGTTCCLFDGSPGGRSVDAAGSKVAPDWTTLWRFAAELKVTFFGAGAAFYANCLKAGVDLGECGDLSRVRALGSTGSPLSPEAQAWGTEQFAHLRANAAAPGRPKQGMAPSGGSDPHAVGERGGDIWWCNISGGTDFCGAFIGGNRELPLIPGEMQCRLLGCAVEAWNEQGEPVIDEVGELVCTQPIPSMPLYLWGDVGKQRYLASYFDTYPGVWRHGDWLKIGRNGGCVIYGRSDATINRHGLRMGTSELYSAVEALPEVLDSMVVDLEYLGRESYMPLFVVLREGLTLDDAVRAKLVNAIKTALSPRFVPDEIFQVAEIPRTLSGKKQELPIKKLLLGQPLDKVLNREAMANPACLDWYVALARARSQP
ncbi:acetoacetate--CoA ligase [Rhodoferax ferrireducens]|uniref:acetoacetate--CoA ligase n=1 Tax=Rhodoferax ferrireducens TaxID=192843 RepID=UPI00298E3208|nr:acetoacetate--CoA ligase [Rhodoferax ferrireducens]WPC66726.1 acetoacetate--CoA ligase [Rhodoferax ferrireducens]